MPRYATDISHRTQRLLLLPFLRVQLLLEPPWVGFGLGLFARRIVTPTGRRWLFTLRLVGLHLTVSRR